MNPAARQAQHTAPFVEQNEATVPSNRNRPAIRGVERKWSRKQQGDGKPLNEAIEGSKSLGH